MVETGSGVSTLVIAYGLEKLGRGRVIALDHDAGYAAGTRHGIVMDPLDGLLRAGEPGRQLTWMDAKVGDQVVTPRIGKPVEVPGGHTGLDRLRDLDRAHREHPIATIGDLERGADGVAAA